MFEKAPRNFLFEKLHALLLLEEHCNALHKSNFNSRVMPSLEASSTTPQKIIGCRKSQADAHLGISKKLFADVLNTKNYLLLRHTLMLLTAMIELHIIMLVLS